MNLPTFPRWVVPASCVLLGLLIGWWLWHPRDAAIETHAPAIDLPGNARVIERVPAAPIPEAIPQAVEELGHGAKLERVVRLTVKPKPKATQPGAQLTTATDCTPVHIDLGLVSLPDETHRVIATTDGVLLNSVDIPASPTVMSKQTKWSAGVAYDILNRQYGAFVDRDLGPFRFGVEVLRTPDVRSYTAVAKVGIRF